MDWTFEPESRIAALPAPLRYPALLLRNLGVRPRPRYVYESDGLATTHFSPFLSDPSFSALYDEMAAEWYTDYVVDVRWRMWLLTSFARQCAGLAGNFAEFGVYRGGCAFMTLATTRPDPRRQLYLFDTFEGIPGAHLTASESAFGLAGRLADTSAQYVEKRLERWRGRFQICAGDVFETLPAVDTGPLAFIHVDLNASAPTLHVLEYAYPRLVPGAIAVFDDYGQAGGADQRTVIDVFFRDQSEEVIVLPTSQAIVIKH